jgi:hypothetical protein
MKPLLAEPPVPAMLKDVHDFAAFLQGGTSRSISVILARV